MKKILIAMIAVLFTVQVNAQGGVAISDDGSQPNASAQLDVQSTDKGVLVPRVELTADLTSALPVTNPAEGLLIYNTGANQTNGFYYWTGSEWKLMLAQEVNGTQIALGSDAAGDVMYHDGTDWVRLAKGTDGQVLTLETGVPAWKDVTTSEPTYTIGLNANLGGYVFFVTPDGKHGLVAETQDQAISNNWYTAQDVISDPTNHSTAGKNFTDWRLPTKHELNLMFLQKSNIGNFAAVYYWSSTEFTNTFAFVHSFSSGGYAHGDKNESIYIRAVRAF